MRKEVANMIRESKRVAALDRAITDEIMVLVTKKDYPLRKEFAEQLVYDCFSSLSHKVYFYSGDDSYVLPFSSNEATVSNIILEDMFENNYARLSDDLVFVQEGFTKEGLLASMPHFKNTIYLHMKDIVHTSKEQVLLPSGNDEYLSPDMPWGKPFLFPLHLEHTSLYKKYLNASDAHLIYHRRALVAEYLSLVKEFVLGNIPLSKFDLHEKGADAVDHVLHNVFYQKPSKPL